MDISEGLDYLLKHFEEPLFPRTVSTKKTLNRQVLVETKEEAIRYFAESDLQDCRISAFSSHDIEMVRPNLIFIDLDDQDALEGTLYNILTELHAHPTILDTGRGLAVILPIKMESWRNVTECGRNGEELSKIFLQFAERHLSGGRADAANHPSLKSCMVRVPSSINSKNGNEVVIQGLWDGIRTDVHMLRFQEFVRRLTENEQNAIRKRTGFVGGTIPYIENLLQRRITDGRIRACNLILIPYLINVRNLSISETTDLLYDYFERHIEKKLITYECDRVMKRGVRPYSLAKMREIDPELYRIVTRKD